MSSALQHGEEPPSQWVMRWSQLVKPGGTVLDVACGHGRHMRWFAQRGQHVTGVDRSAPALAALSDLQTAGRARLVEADIENGPWPLLDTHRQPQQFDAVVVTHYLWRPLLPTLLRCLTPGGVLLYETFSVDHATVGKPSRPEFLLAHGELLATCAALRIVAFEDGYCDDPQRFLQRITAVRPAASGAPGDAAFPPERHPLTA